VLYFSHSARQKFLGGTVYAGIAYGYNELRPYANFGNTASCIEDLKTQALEFSPVTKFRTQSCVVEHGIHITLIGEAMLFPPAITTCSLAKSLIAWEKQIQNSARKLLNGKIKKIHHIGTYNCRSGPMPKVLSEHAYANAIDVTGITTDAEIFISIRDDWHGDAKEALFVRAIATNACQPFSLVLTPNSNEAHADHIHLDNGLYLGGDC